MGCRQVDPDANAPHPSQVSTVDASRRRDKGTSEERNASSLRSACGSWAMRKLIFEGSVSIMQVTTDTQWHEQRHVVG